MNTNARIGKQYPGNGLLKFIKDEDILVEAALRRGQPLSKLIVPVSPSQLKVDLKFWKSAVLSARNVDFPNMNPLYDVYDNIRIDNSLTANIDTRILRVQQARFNWVDQAGKTDEEATKLFKTQWFLDFLKHCMESRFEGYRLVELWEVGEDGQLVECKAVNKYHVKPRLGIITKDPGDDKGTSYLEGPMAVYYLPVGDPEDLGLLYKVAPHVLSKKYAIGNWSEFNEKMGIPFRSVTTLAANAKRQTQLGEIMREMGSAGWAVLNQGEEVKLHTIAGTDPTKCFDALINKLDSERAMLIMGQTITSNSERNKGTYGSMQVLQEVTEDRHEADLVFLNYIVNSQLKWRLMQISPAYSKLNNLTFEWDKSVDLSVSEVVDYVVKLTSTGTYAVPPEFITEKTGIPVTAVTTAAPADEPPSPEPKKKRPVSSAAFPSFYSNICCAGHKFSAAVPSMSDAVLRVARLIFDGEHKGVVDEDLLKKTAEYLRKGILFGFTADSAKLEGQFFQVMERNVYVFSGFKTYQQLKAISSLLKDEEGKLKEWGAFKKDVLKVNSEYNGTWLKAEYDHAVTCGQQADQWLTIQRTKEDLPLLRFVATNDQRTTEICKGLDGTTLPADDPLWDRIFLPLHWGERSHIEQLASGTITERDKIQVPDIHPMFDNNVGKTGVAFPEHHPFYKTSLKVRKKIIDEVYKIYPDTEK